MHHPTTPRARARAWLALALAALAIGLFMPARWATWLAGQVPFDAHNELLVHALLFACAACCLVHARPWRVRPWQVVVLGAVVGAGTEGLQSLVGREAAWVEVGADLVGTCVGLGVALLTLARRSDPAA